jgi:hypothetical protein
MPQSIPAGLTRTHVLYALADLDTGVDHPFGQPTGYELVHEGKRYPPKAVIGLACRYSLGRILLPEEFSGGEAPGQANFVLRKLGFTVVRKGEGEPEQVTDASRILLQLRVFPRHPPGAGLPMGTDPRHDHEWAPGRADDPGGSDALERVAGVQAIR